MNDFKHIFRQIAFWYDGKGAKASAADKFRVCPRSQGFKKCAISRACSKKTEVFYNAVD
jgi:hypothetical protein